MSKIPHIILLGSILIFSSCASSSSDMPEGWEEGKSFKRGWMVGCKRGFKVSGVNSKKAKKDYCDCLFESIMREYPSYKAFRSNLKDYGNKPFYKKADRECRILLEE